MVIKHSSQDLKENFKRKLCEFLFIDELYHMLSCSLVLIEADSSLGTIYIYIWNCLSNNANNVWMTSVACMNFCY